MTAQERNTAVHIQSIVKMVYDWFEFRGRKPTALDYYTALEEWIENGKTPSERELDNIIGIRAYNEKEVK